MSKSFLDPGESFDRIPTYEESVATSSHPSAFRERTTSTTSIIRQERTRRIFELVTTTIIPCFTSLLSNACNSLTVVLVPADALQTPNPVTEQNVVSPSIHKHETTGSVVQLTGIDNRSSFWIQQAVVQELDQILRRELASGSPAQYTQVEPDFKSPPPATTQLDVQPSPDTVLPPRPGKKSWLKRTFVLPGPEHDPTGETGKWDLGWRSPESSNAFEAGAGNEPALWRARERTRALSADEVAVHTRLQDVSFRTESEMGLLETTTVKCIWVEIDVGV